MRLFPVIALCAMFVLVPLALWPGLYEYELLPKTIAFNVCLVALLASLVRLRPRLSLPACCWLGAVMLSWALAPSLGLVAVAEVNFRVGLFLLALGVSMIPAERLRPVWWAATITGGVVALVGIAQYHGADLGIPQTGAPGATFGNRNLAAEYLICCIPVTLWLFVGAWTRAQVVASGLAAALMGALLVYTRCRGAWAGMVVALVLMFPRRACLFRRQEMREPLWPIFPPWIRRRVYAALAFFLALAVLPPHIADPKFSPGPASTALSALPVPQTGLTPPAQDRSVSERLVYWRATLRMIADQPLVGVGPGGWVREYPRYEVASFYERPHNDYLWIAAEYGLIGLGAYLWLLAWSVFRLWRMPDGGRFFCAALVAVHVAALVGFPKEQPGTMIWVWALFGVAGRRLDERAAPRR